MMPYKQLEQAHDVAYRRYWSNNKTAHRKVFRSSVVSSTSCGKISSSIVTFIMKCEGTLSSRFCSCNVTCAAHRMARYGSQGP